jgi:hypothetical protein
MNSAISPAGMEACPSMNERNIPAAQTAAIEANRKYGLKRRPFICDP